MRSDWCSFKRWMIIRQTYESTRSSRYLRLSLSPRPLIKNRVRIETKDRKVDVFARKITNRREKEQQKREKIEKWQDPGLVRLALILFVLGLQTRSFETRMCLHSSISIQCNLLVSMLPPLTDRFAFSLMECILDKERYVTVEETKNYVLPQVNITESVHLVEGSSTAVVAYDVASSRADRITPHMVSLGLIIHRSRSVDF